MVCPTKAPIFGVKLKLVYCPLYKIWLIPKRKHCTLRTILSLLFHAAVICYICCLLLSFTSYRIYNCVIYYLEVLLSVRAFANNFPVRLSLTTLIYFFLTCWFMFQSLSIFLALSLWCIPGFLAHCFSLSLSFLHHLESYALISKFYNYLCQ